ncbi:MAG: MG2 domain-containing protein, partial [Aeromonadaceae bacterium]
MATHWQQPQFYRTLSAGLLVTLSGLACLTSAWAEESITPDEQRVQLARSQPSLQPVPESNYSPQSGSTFYLLSDSSYGSQEEAKVRLEANAREQYYLEQYGGADVRLYRIPDPLAFLKGQKNLHRIKVAGAYRGEGVANTLSYLWDAWYKGSRRSWQRLLDSESRTLATKQAPELSTSGNIDLPTRYEAPTPYAPLKGLPLISQFRYPIWQAKGITPPKGVKLEGSSSEFMTPRPGNVFIPLGKQTPGLYLVEAIIGDHRATTLLFVSDSVVISKIAGHQLLAWSVDRQTGKPLANTQLIWSDGTGTLQSRQSDEQGIALFERQSPEHSYLLARDAQGGLTISENFYYDSEIYNTKIYAFTDRPMYRPGDRVNMKFYGRHFTSARDSQAVADSELELEIIDPAGIPLLKQKSPWRATQGADLSFTLPSDAQAGGYEARFSHGEDRYSAAFRVAEYVKPHFDIQLVLDKPEHKTGEPIKGQLQLRYPNGDPVKQAAVTLSLRAQKLSMVEGDLSYGALFPVKLQQQELKSDDAGNLAFELPAAKEPSRYVLSLLANDSAAWRVKSSREILIERGLTPYQLTSVRQFSAPGESITFEWQPQLNHDKATIESVPSQYQLLRLEDRSREIGALAPGANSLDLPLSRPGSYTLSLLDAGGNLLAATNHWVSGEGMKAAPGAIEVRFDRRSYQAGEEAQALITFPNPVNEALLTLERDKVEQQGLLSQTGNWFKARQLSPTQWQVTIPVEQAYAPNMTFSVLNAQQGEYLFRNAGLKVAQPQVTLAIQSDKASYQPGDRVELTLKSQVGEQPVSAALSVSVVDEMVYLLQPELAPSIHDFFYHPRRNNVRTSSSINFIAYDMSQPYRASGGNGRRFNERGVKMLERPRRDEKDTAAWFPNLQSDAEGNAKVSFIMPDSLTRWRITVRAMTADGVVGQAKSHLLSDKPFYVKWTGPTRFRHGDKPQVELVAFNHQAEAVAQSEEAKVTLEGAVAPQEQSLTLKPGANYLSLPLNELQGGEVITRLHSLQSEPETQSVLDSQVNQLELLPLAWPGLRQQSLSVSGGSATLTLPPDASQLTLTLQPEGRSAFLRVMDELIAYPYGCLEQTASHLIPLSLAYGLLSEPEIKEQVRGELLNHRLRLVQMAGIDGSFGWWGNQSQGSLLLSSYAYYADW